MSITKDPAYKALWRDTSNELMDHDSRMGLGRYAQAREHARRAATGRRQMAEMADAAGEFRWAAANWLSAAACFLLAGDAGPMDECVARARELADAGRIAPELKHIWAALAEREGELRTLLAAAPAGGPVAAPDAAVPAPQP